MTIPTISCEQFVEQLAGYLESDVTDQVRGAIDAHATRCAECGALLADLRELRVNAAALSPRVPERDLWAGIAARIETPVMEISPAGRLDGWTGRGDRRTQRMRRVWTGLAAAGLVLVTATVTHQLTKRSAAPVKVAAAQPTDTPVVNPSATNVARQRAEGEHDIGANGARQQQADARADVRRGDRALARRRRGSSLVARHGDGQRHRAQSQDHRRCDRAVPAGTPQGSGEPIPDAVVERRARHQDPTSADGSVIAVAGLSQSV